MANHLVITVRWDREGMPEVIVITPDEPVVDVVHALALSQTVMAQQLAGTVARALSERDHFRALLEAERESAYAEVEAEPELDPR